MGGSGREVIGRGLWALGSLLGRFWAGRRAAGCGGEVGDWSLNAPGAPVGMCVVRLGPLAVGLAAKSQSGKANFETCTRQLWQLSKEPSTAGTPTWCASLTYQANFCRTGVSQDRRYCKYPPPHLNRQSRTGSCTCPWPHVVGRPCLTVAAHHGRYQDTWSNSPSDKHLLGSLTVPARRRVLSQWLNEAIHKIGRRIQDQHKVAHMMPVSSLLCFEA